MSATASTAESDLMSGTDATASASSHSPPPRGSARVRPSDWRERRRKSEQRSRQKRKDTIESMPDQVVALERVALVLRLISDPDAIWDEFLDDETKRVRDALRRLVPGIDEVKQLTKSKALLTRLLREHRLARDAMDKVSAKDQVTDDWDANVHRWRALARRHFRRLTQDQCVTVMNDALIELHRFTTSQDKETSGLSFMGWRDTRRLLVDQDALQFSLNKTYEGYDLNQHMEMTWRIYSEQALYARTVVSGRARVCLDVLQVISPTAWVVCVAEGYYDMPVNVHDLYLLFRVETDNGAIQYLQCLHDEDLENAINEPSDVWTSNYIWMQWEVLDRTKNRASTDFRLSVGGCLHGGGAEYLGKWMCEILAVLVRSEIVANNRPSLEF